MDKTTLAFLADVMYCKGLICIEEFEAIMDAKNPVDLWEVTEKMLRGEFNAYRKGEAYPDIKI